MDKDGPRGGEAVDSVIVPRTSDIGGFEVRRALPSAVRRMVGPFVFFDQIGPAILRAGSGIDVRPHPHIGLATVTYLTDGTILHRDSLGTVQPIRPGEINWMVAGRGIVHSERSAPEERTRDRPLGGIQCWVALPRRDEETDPLFTHHDAGELPLLEGEGKRVRVLAGHVFGARAPVRTFSEMFYADAVLDAGARLEVPAEHEERALFVYEGRIAVAGDAFEAGRLLVLHPGDPVAVEALTPARLLLLGGEPLDGPRRVWWNFVSHSPERIEQAKADWRAGRFARVPEETEFIPLPDDRPPPVQYP